MAKQKRKVFSKGSSKLLLHDTFVYEVQVFKNPFRTYNLEDTKMVATTQYKANQMITFYRKKIRYTRYTTLKAAPLDWLLANKYKENEEIK